MPLRRCKDRSNAHRQARDIWRRTFGPIPRGWHIHHENGDPFDNRPKNLECLSPKEHAERHPDPSRTFSRKASLAAAAWHRSSAGRRWHRKHGKGVFSRRRPTTRRCQMCFREFISISIRARYCSNACKSAYRRRIGLDIIERVCLGCGRSFCVSRYDDTKNCSRSCAWVSLRRKKPRLQPHRETRSRVLRRRDPRIELRRRPVLPHGDARTGDRKTTISIRSLGP